ncbi:MAG: hypothetical protein WC307_05625 [Candidatus Nanoarchaeia archaeon]|jgi:hypothetical protein
MNDHLPEWYIEITKGLKQKNKKLSPEKKVIINFLKEQIRLLEEE